MFSGGAGILMLWSLVLVAMHKAHLKLFDARPLSYLGVDPQTRSLFCIALTTSAVLFIVFGLYIRSRFSVSNRFMAYLLIGQACQIIVALVPDRAGSSFKIIHTIAGFTLAVSLPFVLSQFARSQQGDKYYTLYTCLLRFEQCAFVVGIGLFIFVAGTAPFGEALPTFGFDIWIITLTYTARIHERSGMLRREALSVI
jgi:hypothetical protein